MDMMTAQGGIVPAAPQRVEKAASSTTKKTEKSTTEDSKFEDLVKEYTKSEQPKTEAPKAEAKKPEVKEEVGKEAEQLAVQLLVDQFSFTPEEALLMLQQIAQTPQGAQFLKALPEMSTEQSVQLNQMLELFVNAQQPAGTMEVQVADLMPELAQVQKPTENSQPNTFAKVLTDKNTEKTADFQQTQPVVVEKAEVSENQLTAQANFKTAVKEAKSMLSESGAKKEDVKVDVDQLQQQVQSMKVNGGIRFATATEQVGMSEKELQNSIASQVKTGIVQNLHTLKGVEKSEFTIKLRPEGLGEITVTMSQTGKDITLNILTQKADTQKLLNAELAQLREALKPYNAQIEQVSAKTEVSYGSFSNGAEQFSGRHGSWQSGGNSNRYYAGVPEGDFTEVLPEEEPIEQFIYA